MIEDNMEFNLYIFTNELLKIYIPLMNVKNKDVLTVVGSGDHALNLILEGAKSVDTYDVNLMAKEFMYLKIANIVGLSYEEFCDYYLSNRINMSKYLNYYKKVRDLLPYESKCFWDKNIKDFVNKEMFLWIHGFNGDKSFDFQNNIYSKELKYYELKSKLSFSKINFINSNLLNLPLKLNKKYGIILCSSIPIFLPMSKLEYYQFISKELIKLLDDDGVLQANYIYDINPSKLPPLPANKNIITSQIFLKHPICLGEQDCVSFVKKITHK